MLVCRLLLSSYRLILQVDAEFLLWEVCAFNLLNPLSNSMKLGWRMNQYCSDFVWSILYQSVFVLFSWMS